MVSRLIATFFGLAMLITNVYTNGSGGNTVKTLNHESENGSVVKKRLVRLEDVKLYTDLVYGSDSPNQKLDIYAPANMSAAPVVVFIHGGGWSTGDKSMYANIGRHFSKNGFCTVLINHRRSPEVHHPEHTKDAAQAFAWVKEHIDGYAGNPGHISIIGHSSGGHIGALLCSDPIYLENVGHTPREIHSFVGISGVYNINLMITLSGYGHVFDKIDKLAASPINYLPACPAFLVYGDKDYPSMPRQSKGYYEHIVKTKGSDAELFIAKGETHESIVINACIEDKLYNQKILEFLRR